MSGVGSPALADNRKRPISLPLSPVSVAPRTSAMPSMIDAGQGGILFTNDTVWKSRFKSACPCDDANLTAWGKHDTRLKLRGTSIERVREPSDRECQCARRADQAL